MTRPLPLDSGTSSVLPSVSSRSSCLGLEALLGAEKHTLGVPEETGGTADDGGTGGPAGIVGDGARQEIPQPATWDFLDSQQSIRNSDDLLEQRAEMIETVFKGPLPTRLPDAVEAITDEYYPGLAVERLTIETDDFASIDDLIQPPLWTGGLALYDQGHAGDFRTNSEDTIQGLLDARHHVLAFAMPMRGMNTHPYDNNCT